MCNSFRLHFPSQDLGTVVQGHPTSYGQQYQVRAKGLLLINLAIGGWTQDNTVRGNQNSGPQPFVTLVAVTTHE